MSAYTDARDGAKLRNNRKVDLLPINKPSMAIGATPADAPALAERPKHENSRFFRTHKNAMDKDFTYKRTMAEMQPIVSALRKKVERGVLPMAVAEKRIQQALEDQRFNAGYDKQKIKNNLNSEEYVNEFKNQVGKQLGQQEIQKQTEENTDGE